jgi:adenine deaminase
MQRKSRLLSGLVAIALTLALIIGNRFVLPVFAQSPYDIVILNGRVMDPETEFDGIRNVGIKDGRIVTITEDDISGNETIDATDHVVAPGFIDTHFHWTRPIGYKVALRDGVTTAMDLEAGVFGPRVDDGIRCMKAKAR